MDATRVDLPTRSQAASFWLRAHGLRLLRHGNNAVTGVRRYRAASDVLADAPIRAQVYVDLWRDKRADEFALLAGKVQNLRVAAAAFDGLVVPADGCMSFWTQLGKPSGRRGFVLGREVREGCVVPTVGGGICQISNALATCAIRAGFELVERHAHSAPVESAETDDFVDATVFWNYIDLKIRAQVVWRLDVALTAEQLVVTIRTLQSVNDQAQAFSHVRRARESEAKRAPLRSCGTCGETGCFRQKVTPVPIRGRTAWLLDTCTPEFSKYLGEHSQECDVFRPLPPRQLAPWLTRRPIVDGWPAEWHKPSITLRLASAALARAWSMRIYGGRQGRRQAAVLQNQRKLAEAYMGLLRPEHTHLVIDQALLATLHGTGVLGGRSYDVLTSTLPMSEVQRRLDLASAEGHRGNETLTDFRAEPSLVAAEYAALVQAARIVTPHAEVVAYWRNAGHRDLVELPWSMPPQNGRASVTKDEPTFVFPASALARKGAYELAEALQDLHCRLLVLGKASDDGQLWSGVNVEYVTWQSDWLARADVVVLPAHIEHSPRGPLLALARGIPVIATPACGLHGFDGLHIVPAGSVALLRQTIIEILTTLNRLQTAQRGQSILSAKTVCAA